MAPKVMSIREKVAVLLALPRQVGRIHMGCHGCNRKRLNRERIESDPHTTIVYIGFCPTCCDNKCHGGCKGHDEYFFNKAGREIEWWRTR